MEVDAHGPYEGFAGIYDRWCAGVVEDVPFYRAICLGCDGPVVELAAGTGRIAVPLAVDGARVWALDLSPDMLGRLRERAAAAGVADRVETAIGDLRDLPALPRTDRVLVPFRALLHLEDDAQRAALLARVRDALVPGGLLAFDVFEPTGADVRATQGRWITRDDSGVRERATWDLAAGTLDLEVRLRGEGTRMLLHFIPGARWAELLEEAGLDLVAAFAGFEGQPYTGRAGDSVWLAQRVA